MYHQGLLSAGAGTVLGAALPFTGLNLAWSVVAGFALLMAAGAIWRVVPRRQA